MFETNPAEFLIAGLNFGKISSLHEYCLGVLRARLACSPQGTLSMRKHIRLYTGIFLRPRYNLRRLLPSAMEIYRRLLAVEFSLDYKM